MTKPSPEQPAEKPIAAHTPIGPRAAIRLFLKDYAQFKGYSTRGEFWWPWLSLFLVHLAIGLTTVFLVTTSFSDGIMSYTYNPANSPEYYRRVWFEGPANTVVTIAILLHFLIWAGTISPLMAVTWRRFHDTGLPGPIFFLWFIPVIGWIIVLILLGRGSKPTRRRPEWATPAIA